MRWSCAQLDLGSGESAPLVSNGHVNVDPRWSPDGTRIAFVSTQHEGRWHVFVGLRRRAARPLRLTEDRNSGLPRYYYSAWDHYLSPTWSPDGKELILVSNRGRIWGSGGFWRMAAEAGAPMREIHYEETTWKARPDWAPDGRRVVYSSYHGRQWNQLWVMTARGRRSAAADLRRVRPHRSALVPRRAAHRRHLQRRRQHVAGA